jgi:hypothetical protein
MLITTVIELRSTLANAPTMAVVRAAPPVSLLGVRGLCYVYG